MKKLLPVLFLSLLLLVGCSGSGPAQTVANLYKAAVDHDTETFVRIMSHFEEDVIGYEEEAMDDIASMAIDAGGIDKMNITEVNKNNIIDEASEFLTDEYGENWAVVSADLGDEVYFVWVLHELDGNYYVVSGDDLSKDEFLK